MSKTYKIPISKPSLTEVDFKEIKRCYDSSWISSKSPWVERFEKSFAQKASQTKYAVGVNSGTSALFLALKSLGIGKGDEVILPSLTMIATVNAVNLSGAKPVLVDCTSRNDWNIAVEAIKKKITNRTKAIMPVHIYGYSCDMGRILKIAKRHGLAVVEDAAEAIGSLYKGKKLGSFGQLSCYSLYVNKIITAGNGGVVCTNSKRLRDRVRQLSFFDFNPKSHFTHQMIGYNLVLSGLQAALALSQLRRLDRLLAKRRKVFRWYQRYLGENAVCFLEPTVDQDPNYWFPAAVFVSKSKREKVRLALKEKGIETRIFFRPIHLQPAYRGVFKDEKLPNSEYFYTRGLLLPSYFDLTEEEVKFVSGTITRYGK